MCSQIIKKIENSTGLPFPIAQLISSYEDVTKIEDLACLIHWFKQRNKEDSLLKYTTYSLCLFMTISMVMDCILAATIEETSHATRVLRILTLMIAVWHGLSTGALLIYTSCSKFVRFPSLDLSLSEINVEQKLRENARLAWEGLCDNRCEQSIFMGAVPATTNSLCLGIGIAAVLTDPNTPIKNTMLVSSSISLALTSFGIYKHCKGNKIRHESASVLCTNNPDYSALARIRS